MYKWKIIYLRTYVDLCLMYVCDVTILILCTFKHPTSINVGTGNCLILFEFCSFLSKHKTMGVQLYCSMSIVEK